ncbi:MAG TPA: pyrroline-5-carboxylate reductase [Methylomirabilota bacterium]|jgi:pyrroline-5-carboxylate reductase|nr:pyrroline-5-carboxylate reductase [Methylomirabilota bacterium]
MRLDGELLLIGCGKMGGAMLEGWLAQGLPPGEVVIVEPGPEIGAGLTRRGLRHVSQGALLPEELRPAVILLAVKPQMMEAAIADLGPVVRPGTLVLSIAAGKTLGYFERSFGAGTAVVRAMPNTPAAVGRGITVAVGNEEVTPAQRATADALLAAVGEVSWVEEESLIDAVTAVSGGGPAYVFLLMEVLAEAGIASGLPPDLARRLARRTVEGAGELSRLSQESPEILRKNVTSPAGTTLEALKILMAEDGLQPLFTRAIAAATRRSRELAD